MGDLNPLLAEDPERIGPYVLVGRLGRLQPPVHLGHLPDEDTLRAIRILPPRPGIDPGARAQITDGLEAVRRVSGAHTAKLIEVGWDGDTPYVVREHIEGRSLREAVTADGPLTGDALERLAVATLTALTAVHLSGMTHGGLSPDTVLLGPDGPLVCDIGLGVIGPEPDYRAPEHIQAELTPGTGAVPGRPADVFSWAATVLYAATGRSPFGGQLDRLMNGPANLVGLPADLAGLLAVCLSKRPQERPDTKAAMLRLLGEQQVPQITGDDWLPEAPQAPVPGRPEATLPQPAVPSGWGAPPLPSDPPPPDPQGPVVMQLAPEPEKRPRNGKLSVALAACVGGAVLLSGAGIWAAGQYTSLGSTEQVAAQGGDGHSGLSRVAQGNGQGQSQDQGQGDGGGGDTGGYGDQGGIGDQPTAKVTVPWNATVDPQVPDVSPMKLATETPLPPPIPSITAYPTAPPVPVPTAPAQPTAQPTAPAQPTAQPTDGNGNGNGHGRGRNHNKPEVDPTPAPTPPPSGPATPQPTDGGSPAPTAPETPQPSGPATPVPTAPTTPQPSVSPTWIPTPVPTATATRAPRPTHTPRPTWSQRPTRTAEPKPTRTWSPRPTSSPKPTRTVEPTQPPKPTWSPKPTRTAVPTVIPPAPTSRPSTSAPERPTPPPTRTNPYSPEKVCGAGFYVQRSVPFAGGTAYQLYNSSNGLNCAVTMKTANVGVASPVWATLEVQNGESKTDRGSYEFYAGPVILSGKGKCVRVSGGSSTGDTSSGWANCG
ncbi:serine/threonine protein kinase [Streptosporangium sp. NPDC004379]|uniref:serine/threonine protein kinase n=1 Tax=Streptosporangium sp. NPDC004379 TaxID=3366189 RepID=UPI0036C6696D